MTRRTRWLAGFALGALALWGAGYAGNDLARAVESDAPSRSVGETNGGRLVHGKRLPTRGPGFATYSRLGSALGRTATHHRVRDAMLDAYAALHAERPQTTFLYGETGWPDGGRFRPHRTHQNGLSVDFMTPVLRDGVPDVLPTGPLHGFGYGVDFDAEGRNATHTIDFDALAAHLYHLDRAARANGLAVEVVILAPDLQDELAAAARGADVVRRLRLSRNPSWVRHDDHYHVDFRLVGS